MSVCVALPCAAATWMPLRVSAMVIAVWASLNFTPPANAPTAAALPPRLPSRPPTPPPTPPAFGSENTMLGVRMKSAATIWP